MSETERRLTELNEGYVRAAQDADVAWYREHLAEDYLCSTVDGAIELERAGDVGLAAEDLDQSLGAVHGRPD